MSRWCSTPGCWTCWWRLTVRSCWNVWAGSVLEWEHSPAGPEDWSVSILLTINLRVDTLVLEDNKVEEWDSESERWGTESAILVIIMIIYFFVNSLCLIRLMLVNITGKPNISLTPATILVIISPWTNVSSVSDSSFSVGAEEKVGPVFSACPAPLISPGWWSGPQISRFPHLDCLTNIKIFLYFTKHHHHHPYLQCPLVCSSSC